MLDKITKKDLPNGVLDIVDLIGIDAFKSLVRFVGGSSLYIPSESSIIKEYRNKIIRDEFNGDYRFIARKYCLSEVQVRNIVNFDKIKE